MSNGAKNPHHYDPFDYNHHETDRSSFPLLFNYGTNYPPPPPPLDQQPHQTLDHQPISSFMSFTDCLHGSTDYTVLSKAFDLSCLSSEVISPPPDYHDHDSSKIQQQGATAGTTSTTENPSTPNSSASYSSTEAAPASHGHDCKDSDQKSKKDKQPKQGSEEVAEEEEDKSKKGSKAKKKEKRKREQRFAFLTKSEVDHLEDGYRWRKYGQKAVKNSPYPRSYYKCTTQKCTVKKRVERSFQDPTIVVTTYEGQHNHHCPATLRGSLNLNLNDGVGMLSPNYSLCASASLNGVARFPRDFLSQFLPMTNQSQLPSRHHDHDHQSSNNSMLYSNLMTPQLHHQEQLHVPDYGLLQDLVPSFVQKQEH